jgi:hypothetical protein
VPTPCSRDWKHWNKTNPKASRLSDYVKMLPTPTVNGNHNRKGISKNSGNGLATVVKMYPTPAGSDGLRGGTITDKMTGQSLVQYVNSTNSGNGGLLNPAWVAWLMGFPTEYLPCGDSATPKSHCKRQWLSLFCRRGTKNDKT